MNTAEYLLYRGQAAAGMVGLGAPAFRTTHRLLGHTSAKRIRHSVLHPLGDRQVIFIHIPKCAGVSVLSSIFGIATQPGHTPWIAVESALGRDIRDLASVAVIRPPAERLHSAFRYLKSGGINSWDKIPNRTFLSEIDNVSDFVDRLHASRTYRAQALGWIHFVPQRLFVENAHGSVGVGRLFPISRLDHLRSHLSDLCGRDLPAIGVTNASGFEMPDISPNLRRRIEALYPEDTALYEETCSM